jgi:hypothetical protein
MKNQETPEGQKFHIGEIVRITNPKRRFYVEQGFPKDTNFIYEIQYSYYQKYGGNKEKLTKEYSLKHLFEEGGETSWYDENDLELVKGIEDISEERDLLEYKRLKDKYEA